MKNFMIEHRDGGLCRTYRRCACTGPIRIIERSVHGRDFVKDYPCRLCVGVGRFVIEVYREAYEQGVVRRRI